MRQAPITLRRDVPPPPHGRERFSWWGPGLLWAMSAVGSGSVLFTPIVGSRYGYELLWLLLVVCLLMWIMISEAGRFAVATGRTLLDGFSTLPGPRNWALWLIFVPQLWAAVVGVGGLSALVGSVLQSALPGGLLLWSLCYLTLSTALVASGGYRAVSRIAQVLAGFLVVALTVAAVGVGPSPDELGAGMRPSLPPDPELSVLLPWVGTILAGSMGIIWYGYWAATRGYGGRTAGLSRGEHEEGERVPSGEIDAEERHRRLLSWLRTMTRTAGLGVVVGTLVISSFLVLGSELLRPEGIVPSGIDAGRELTRLLSETWGRAGHWLMTLILLVTLGGSVLANQDGWGRSFADISLLLPLRGHEDGADERSEREQPRWIRFSTCWRPPGMARRKALKIVFVVAVTGLLPAAVILWLRDPVEIMSLSGIIASLHTPFIVVLCLMLNRRLPAGVRPGGLRVAGMVVAATFYASFALLYLLDLLGSPGG